MYAQCERGGGHNNHILYIKIAIFPIHKAYTEGGGGGQKGSNF